MSTVIRRNSFIFDPEMRAAYGAPPFTPPPDVAYYTRSHSGAPLIAHTWAEVMQTRRERQADRLDRKRNWFVESWRPVYLDVRYYDIEVYTGWHTYIYGVGGIRHWFRRPKGETIFMSLLPLRDGLFPVQSHEHWMEVFARTYQCGTQDRRPRGRLIIWALVSGAGQNATLHGYSLTKPPKNPSK